MKAHQPISAIALVDSSPVLVLPSVLALKATAGEAPVRLRLLGPPHYQSAVSQLAQIFRRRGIEVHVLEAARVAESLEDQLSGAWADALAHSGSTQRVLDVSAAAGGSTARAIAALERAGAAEHHLVWFSEGSGLVRFLARPGHTSREIPLDIGSAESGQPVTPSEFLAILGLQERLEAPYGAVAEEMLLGAALELLTVYRADARWDGVYGTFRQRLRPPGSQKGKKVPFREMASDEVPLAMRPIVERLAQHPGWVVQEGSRFRLTGPDDSAAVFFLSGGWLELVVAEAIRRALPGRHVHVNLGTSWGHKRQAEAETDVTFIHGNCLYLLSCKNEAVQDRFFPHLDRFRALVAEFGESRTRPVLLSTAQLEWRHLQRCAAYEIGAIDGPHLLDSLYESLHGRPSALLERVLEVSQAPRAGLA